MIVLIAASRQTCCRGYNLQGGSQAGPKTPHIKAGRRTRAHEDDVGLAVTAVHDVAALGALLLGRARQVGHALPREGQDAGARLAVWRHRACVLHCHLQQGTEASALDSAALGGAACYDAAIARGPAGWSTTCCLPSLHARMPHHHLQQGVQTLSASVLHAPCVPSTAGMQDCWRARVQGHNYTREHREPCVLGLGGGGGGQGASLPAAC